METTFNYELALSNIDDKKRTDMMALTNNLKSSDLSTVTSFGASVSSAMSTTSAQLLDSIKSNSSNEIVDLTNSLLAELNLIDIDELEDTKFKQLLRKVPIIGKFVKNIENAIVKYDTINNNVGKIANKISSTKIIALRDNSTIQQMFDKNVEYISQIRDLVIALKLKKDEANSELDSMRTDATVDAINIHDQENFITAIEKRISDLQTTEYILTQNLFQIRATQTNNLAISEKADYIVNNVMPIWRSQLALAIINANQKSSIEAQQKIQDATNTMLKKNAEMLKTNSIAVAKSAEQNVVSVSTLQDTTNKLIETIKEVNKIHAEAKSIRDKQEGMLNELANQLMTSINTLE